MRLPVIIVGGGGHAKVLIDALRISGVDILGITDADPNKLAQVVCGMKVIGNDLVIAEYSSEEVLLVNGFGSVHLPTIRADLFDRFKTRGYSFASVIHPSAVIATDVELSEGAQVMAGAVIQPGSRIGANSLINTRVGVDHDCLIGEHVHLSPGVTLSGGVRVGNGTHIGAGATVIQGIAIGRGCLVAAGAVVIRGIPDGAVVRGVPAKEVGA